LECFAVIQSKLHKNLIFWPDFVCGGAQQLRTITTNKFPYLKQVKGNKQQANGIYTWYMGYSSAS